MASDLHFMEFIGDQLRGLAPVSWRKMFGEYALYHQAKVVAFVCDNQIFLKPTPAAQALLSRPVWGHPYPGSKPYLLITEWVDERELLADLIRTTADALPEPALQKPKRARSTTPRKAKSDPAGST